MGKVTNKELREVSEMKNLFADPRYCREVWRGVGNLLLQNPATKSPSIYDKNGNFAGESAIANYSYEKLSKELKELYKENREPTELEMIIMCQLVKARYDTSAAVFIRDTLGARPVDETKVEQAPSEFDKLSDEELNLLAQFRASKRALEESTPPAQEQFRYVGQRGAAGADAGTESLPAGADGTPAETDTPATDADADADYMQFSVEYVGEEKK